MIKFKNGPEREFWKKMIARRFGSGNWNGDSSIDVADEIIERLRERENDQAERPPTASD